LSDFLTSERAVLPRKSHKTAGFRDLRQLVLFLLCSAVSIREKLRMVAAVTFLGRKRYASFCRTCGSFSSRKGMGVAARPRQKLRGIG
jgi:hypothetical protein